MTRSVDNFINSRRGATHGRAQDAFTIIELIVVMTIIALLVAISIPAVRSVSKSNDASQAENLVRSIVGTARSIAVAQHRMAGVVFFEETGTFSQPVNANQTAMQLFIEDFNQAQYAPPAGVTYFVKYTSARQYLPAGMKIAALTDTSSSVETGDASAGAGANYLARAILFDSNGQLVMRDGLAAPSPTIPPPVGAPGNYPQAYGDWRFLGVAANGSIPAVTDANSYPGFFIYRKDEYDNQPASNRVAWLRLHSSVILVNANTGTVIVDRGTGQ